MTPCPSFYPLLLSGDLKVEGDKKSLGNVLNIPNFHKSRPCGIFKTYVFWVQGGPPQRQNVPLEAVGGAQG